MWPIAQFAIAGLAVDAASAEPPLVIAPEGLKTLQADPPMLKPDPNAPPARCIVRVHIGVDGRPVDDAAAIEARSCPERYGDLAAEAIAGWSWQPVRVDGAPAEVLAVVAIGFTGRGRVPVAPAERCTYTLTVRPGGDVAVAPAANAIPQCEIWPVAHVAGPVPEASRCNLGVDASLVRDTDGWLVPEECPDEALEVGEQVVSGSLFVTGTKGTRFVLDLPDAVGAPTTVGVAGLDIPTVTVDGPARIDAGASGDDGPMDPTLAVPEGTKAPTIDLSDLRSQMKKPAPAPVKPPPTKPAPPPPPPAPPAPEPAPEPEPEPDETEPADPADPADDPADAPS